MNIISEFRGSGKSENERLQSATCKAGEILEMSWHERNHF
jgi:hypothetical protein